MNSNAVPLLTTFYSRLSALAEVYELPCLVFKPLLGSDGLID